MASNCPADDSTSPEKGGSRPPSKTQLQLLQIRNVLQKLPSYLAVASKTEDKSRTRPAAAPGDHNGRRHDVFADLNYYLDPGDGSLPTPVVVGNNEVTNNRPTIPVAVKVRDISGHEADYRLDTHGFQLVQHSSREVDFVDESSWKDSYYAETELLYKQVTGAQRVIIFGHRVRRGPSNWHSLGAGNTAHRGPLRHVHVDQSNAGAEIIARRKLPASEVETLLKGRYQIVNIWRPIRTIRKDPLAVGDARSFPDSDLLPASVVYADGSRGETWTVRPNTSHRWFFKYGQRPDEVLFIKCFDSEDGEGMARRSPHCAFSDPGQVDQPSRESVEVRALLFY